MKRKYAFDQIKRKIDRMSEEPFLPGHYSFLLGYLYALATFSQISDKIYLRLSKYVEEKVKKT